MTTKAPTAPTAPTAMTRGGDSPISVGSIHVAISPSAAPVHLPDGSILEVGSNAVPESWADMRKNPAVKLWLREGIINESEARHTGKGLSRAPQHGATGWRPDSTNDLSVEKAAEYIRFETSMDRLRTWGGNDQRPEIAEAILDRMKVLDPQGR